MKPEPSRGNTDCTQMLLLSKLVPKRINLGNEIHAAGVIKFCPETEKEMKNNFEFPPTL